MTLVEDAILLVKKIVVTIIIYLVPVTIVVSGLLLTEKILGNGKPKSKVQISQTTSTLQKQ